MSSIYVRLVSYFAMFMLLVQLVILTAGYVSAQKVLYDRIEADLKHTSESIQRNVIEHSHFIYKQAQTLVSDFGFKQTIATGDQPTIQSALVNLSTRIGGNLTMLVSLDGRIIARSMNTDKDETIFPFERMLGQENIHESKPKLAIYEDQLSAIVLVPVLAPRAIAWLAVISPINAEQLKEFKVLSRMDVELSATMEMFGGEHKLLSTSATDDTPYALLGSEGIAPNQIFMQKHGQDSWLSLLIPIQTAHGSEDAALLIQHNTLPERQIFIRALSIYGAFTFFVLLTCILVVSYISMGITRPIETFKKTIEFIASGDYSRKVIVNDDGDFKALADGFNMMMDSIHKQQQKIKHQLNYNIDTNLPNRAWFEDSLKEKLIVSRGDMSQIAVCIVAIDNYQEINFTIGHNTSIKFIRAIAERMQGTVKKNAIMAQIGSNKFAVAIPFFDYDAIDLIIQTIVQAQEHPIVIDDISLDVRVHVGYCIYPQDSDTGSELLQKAEVALMSAYNKLQRYAIYDSTYDNRDSMRLSLMSELRDAIHTDQLEIYVQPKICLKENTICGVEALVRWQHPREGFMSPDLFIPLAEKTGQIVHLTRYVMDKMIDFCKKNKELGRAFTTTINLSARDLQTRDLPSVLQEKVDAANLEPHWLGLEITESHLIDDPQVALSILHTLKSMGFKLSIDDFGEGYSSMGYLKMLPVDELKIDKQYIRTLIEEPKNLAIVEATIILAHKLGLECVAEGVEDEETMNKLRTLNCEQVQGYYVSKPMSLKDFELWLKDCPYGLRSC